MFYSHLNQRTLMRRLLLAFALLLPCVASAGPAADHMSTPGKPNAGLALGQTSEYRLEPGQAQTLLLELSSQANQGMLVVELASSASELELLSPPQYRFDLGQDAAPELSVELLPRKPGRYYLMLNAQLTPAANGGDGAQPQYQSLGVVIQVGEPPRKAFKNDAVPGVVPMQAEETIRRQ